MEVIPWCFVLFLGDTVSIHLQVCDQIFDFLILQVLSNDIGRLQIPNRFLVLSHPNVELALAANRKWVARNRIFQPSTCTQTHQPTTRERRGLMGTVPAQVVSVHFVDVHDVVLVQPLHLCQL